MAIYQLSDSGRQMTFKAWKKAGGCGVPNNSNAFRGLGPLAGWRAEMTLGEIEDACPYTGRCIARFAVEHLEKTDMAIPYQNPMGRGQQ